jgi:hypothetical protein
MEDEFESDDEAQRLLENYVGQLIEAGEDDHLLLILKALHYLKKGEVPN